MSLFLSSNFEDTSFTKQEDPSALKTILKAAHDIRSPLSALNMTIHYFKKSHADDMGLQLLDEAMQRINSIAGDILKSRKAPAATRECFDVKKLAMAFQKSADLRFQGLLQTAGINTLKDQISVIGNEEHMTRVLWNLVQNSLEASASQITLSFDVKSKFVSLKLSDNGAGIPQQIIAKVLTEGFTTKTNGNGLGLSSSVQNIRSWGGDLKIKSKVDFGTTIEMYLPLVTA